MTLLETNLRQETLTADQVMADMSAEWDKRYRPEPELGLPSTEERLGLVQTELRQVSMPGRHKLWVLNETDQPTGAYKANGMAWFVDKLLEGYDEDEPDSLPNLYTFSAGNAGAGLVYAGGRRGLHVQVETPATLVDAKRRLLQGPTSSVRAVHDSVEAAGVAAMAAAESDPKGVFVHAYDDFDVIVGQSMVAHRALRSLLQQDARGAVDLDNDNVRILVQRGGGSLLTGFACALRQLKDEGIVGDNVNVYAVRPEESHERYDGLHVTAPGSIAQAVLEDPRYVAGTVNINDVDTGTALRDMAQAFNGKRFESSGVAGVAGFKHLQSEEIPTVNVAVLTGANYSDEGYAYFQDASRRREQHLLHTVMRGWRTELSPDDPVAVIANQRSPLGQINYGPWANGR